MDDFIHCSCCCPFCKRKNEIMVGQPSDTQIDQYPEWEPLFSIYAAEYKRAHKCCRGWRINCCSNDRVDINNRRSSYDPSGAGIDSPTPMLLRETLH